MLRLRTQFYKTESAVLPTKTLSLATATQLFDSRNLNLAITLSGHPDELPNLRSQMLIATDAITQLEHATVAIPQANGARLGRFSTMPRPTV